MSLPVPPAHDPYAALRIPSFRLFIFGMLALTFATQVQGLVVAWQIYAITKDPLSLGLIGLAEALPFIGFALPAGHVADMVDRRRMTLAATAVLIVGSVTLLALATRPPASMAHVRAMYGVILVNGVARSFLQPARQALGAELVPRALYPNAVTWRSLTWQVAAVGGPAAGGVLYGFAGPAAAYTLDTVLMTVAFVAFLAVRHRSPAR